jgi:hypothetical protein
MGAIDTEDAARRLARVILSDIDLYMRERPKAGESREAQIEEGRRLFVSRVTPELVPVFEMVVADRAAGTVSTPAPPTAPPIDDEPATDPSIAVPSFEDHPPSAPVPVTPPVAVALPPPPLVTRPAADPPARIQPARIPIRRLVAVASALAAIAAVCHCFFR